MFEDSWVSILYAILEINMTLESKQDLHAFVMEEVTCEFVCDGC